MRSSRSLVAAALLCAWHATAQAGCPAGPAPGDRSNEARATTEAVVEITRFCAGLSAEVSGRERVFAVVALDPGAEARWTELSDRYELEGFEEVVAVPESARVGQRTDGAAVVEWRQRHTSGAWSLELSLCFGADGSLRAMRSDFTAVRTTDDGAASGTSSGARRVRERIYAGRRLLSESQRTTTPSGESGASLRFVEPRESSMATLAALPFARLLMEPSARERSLWTVFAAEDAQAVEGVAALPPAFRQLLSTQIPEGLAAPGTPFNATDVAVSALLARRLLESGRAGPVWFVWYEHGGRGLHQHLVLWTEGAPEDSATATLSNAQSLAALQKLVRSGAPRASTPPASHW